MSETPSALPEGSFAPRPHAPWGTPGVIRFVLYFFAELFAILPDLLRLRFELSAARSAPKIDGHYAPTALCVSDNLDEVNGIALASRIQLRELRRLGHSARLFGVAFHTKRPRQEGAEHAMTLAPGRFSMDQAGYANSELVVVRLKSYVEYLREHKVDLVEFETPGPVSTLCLFATKILGIPTLSHYRTDIIVYSEALMKSRFGILFTQWWTRTFTRLAGPVIVPSEAYREKVAAMGVPLDHIHKLPRGVDLEFFRPDLRDGAIWARFGIPDDGVKLLYVGRVSVEKNLAVLCDEFLEALAEKPDLRLIVVGDGPFLDEMKARLAACGRAHFTGVLRDGNLARVFASADLFVFPSLADTFGNSVVEALASGLPCLVSDLGGPREIVVPGECGMIFDHAQPHAVRDGILTLTGEPLKLESWRSSARMRATEFSYEAAANAFWTLYGEVWGGKKSEVGSNTKATGPV